MRCDKTLVSDQAVPSPMHRRPTTDDELNLMISFSRDVASVRSIRLRSRFRLAKFDIPWQLCRWYA